MGESEANKQTSDSYNDDNANAEITKADNSTTDDGMTKDSPDTKMDDTGADFYEGVAAIEAILFTMGDSVEINTLARTLLETPGEVRKQIKYLKEKYSSSESGIELLELDSAVQLCTKKDMFGYLIKIAKTPRKAVLTDALLETLSIIAYKQPVTKGEIEKIRGVNSDHAVNRLVEFNLVSELGRMDAPGRPLLFGTTEEFLRSFGVKSLDELPSVSAVQVEEFKHEAEDEAKVRLDI